ncbi:MAG: GNAT family N-acetyltransferase [Hydrogenibacillus sp.]|nr:GNAT family N-acetyltransferase [Hydrogenibacillus sp.]
MTVQAHIIPNDHDIGDQAETRRAVFDIRRRVFIDEQGVPEALEIDAYDDDPKTVYILLTMDGEPAGCLRLRPYRDGAVKVERVAVLPSFRSRGAGRALMKAAEAWAKTNGHVRAYLHAQRPVVGFYERLGYRKLGAPFTEAGIEHVAMEKPLQAHTKAP